jgi:hypothetical protein
MDETRRNPLQPPRTPEEWFTFLRASLPPEVTDRQIAEGVSEALRHAGAWRPMPTLDPDATAQDEQSHRRRGKARWRTQERQIAEGPNDILPALNRLHQFRLANKTPYDWKRARQLQLALGSSGKAFAGRPSCLTPLVLALEVMAHLITSDGLRKETEHVIADRQVAWGILIAQDQAHVRKFVLTRLGLRPQTLLGGGDPTGPPVDHGTLVRGLMEACVQSLELLETMAIGWNFRAAMALLARLSGAPPEWRGRVYRCGGPACMAPYQIWLAQPGAGRRPKSGAKPTAAARICRSCRSRASENRSVKPAKARHTIPA